MDAGSRLDQFISRYAPEVADDGRRALKILARKFPTATKIVYDNYNALAVGFSASDRGGDAILSIALYPRYVSLFLLQGASLKDPSKLFNSSLDGNVRRAIDIHKGEEIDAKAFKALVQAAVALNTSGGKNTKRK